MKYLYLFLIVCVQLTYAQFPGVEWQKTFGGSNGDNAYSIRQTTDGGYIFVSYTMSENGDITNFYGNSDIWVVKTSTTGAVEWQKTLGGSEGDYSQSIQQTADGGYVLVGYTYSIDGDITEEHDNLCAWVVKLSAGGNIEWQKIYPLTHYNEANVIRQTSDGGYIVLGNNYAADDDPDGIGNHGGGDIWVLKLSSLGIIEWQKSLGGSLSDSGGNIEQTTDGGYMVLGSSNSNDGDVTMSHNMDYWVLKLSGTGDIVWQKTFGGPGYDTAIGLNTTNDGGCVVAGRIQASGFDVTLYHGFVDAWVIKLNASGTLEWQKSFGGSSTDVLFDIKQTPDGGYIAVGTTSSFDGDVSGNHPTTIATGDCWVVRLSSAGSLLWQKCLGGSISDSGNRIVLTNDGGYIISGVALSSDGDITFSHGNDDCWIIKLAPEALSITDFNEKELNLYPNPATSILTLQNEEGFTYDSISVSDLTGKKVLAVNEKANQIDVSTLASGIYLIEAISDAQKFTKKFVKQ
jgi:hypothetical protein